MDTGDGTPQNTQRPIHLLKGRHTKSTTKKQALQNEIPRPLGLWVVGPGVDANSKGYAQCIQLGFRVICRVYWVEISCLQLSKKAPTNGPTEWTPKKPEYLIALATSLGVRW